MRFLLLPMLALPLFAQTDWPSFGHDPGGQRYSPLAQVNTTNVAKLKLAWRVGFGGSEVTSIVAGGLMYYSLPTANRVVALEPETGKEVWAYDLGAAAPQRGVTYWPGDKQNPARIISGSGDARLIALNAQTGRLIVDFGVGGSVDLRAGVADKFPKLQYLMNSPAGLYKDLIITGTRGTEKDLVGPLQDVRAWDVRTGKLVWTFHLNPHPGEFGNDTWPAGSWIDAASPSAWGVISVDVARGLIFIPVGQPGSGFYGGERPGSNLFSSSVIALDAATGKRRWHFQITHHDVLDLDAAATPALMNVTQGGKTIPAVVVVSKASLMFFLDRTTGKPIYPVEERPVPQSQVPGEKNSATQPYPVKPPPLGRQSIGADEIFSAEPNHAKFCRDLVAKIGGIHNLGPYTPLSDKEYRIFFPGGVGGVNWGGVSIDPTLGYVFVKTSDRGGLGILVKHDNTYDMSVPARGGFMDWDKQLPCQPAPWAHLTAVNANTGEIAWSVVLGSMDEMEAKGVHNTGALGTGGSISTAGGLLFISATVDKRFRAFDSRTGKLLWEVRLPAQSDAVPMTYQGKDGKQYVAISSSGLSVYALE